MNFMIKAMAHRLRVYHTSGGLLRNIQGTLYSYAKSLSRAESATVSVFEAAIAKCAAFYFITRVRST